MIEIRVLALNRRIYNQIPVSLDWSQHDLETSTILGWVNSPSAWDDNLVVEKNGVYTRLQFTESVHGSQWCAEVRKSYQQIYLA